MSNSYSKCVVPYCGHVKRKQGDCLYAKFPLDVQRCRLWLRIAGVEDLVYLPSEKLSNIRYMCGCHFTDDQFINSSRKRLKRTAIPTLADSRVVPLSDTLLQHYPLQHDSNKNDVSIEGIDAVANHRKTQVDDFNTANTNTIVHETRINTEAITLPKEKSLKSEGNENERLSSEQCKPSDTAHVETDSIKNGACSSLLETENSSRDEQPPAVKEVFLVRYNKPTATREINMDGVIVEKARVIISHENTSSMEICPASDSKIQQNRFGISEGIKECQDLSANWESKKLSVTELPKRWGFTEMNVANGPRLLFTYTVMRVKRGINSPVTQKSVTLDNEGNLCYFVYGNAIDRRKNNLPLTCKNTTLMPQVLERFLQECICIGIGSIDSRCIPYEEAFKDYVDTWRSNECPLLSIIKRCDSCDGLRNTALREEKVLTFS